MSGLSRSLGLQILRIAPGRVRINSEPWGDSPTNPRWRLRCFSLRTHSGAYRTSWQSLESLPGPPMSELKTHILEVCEGEVCCKRDRRISTEREGWRGVIFGQKKDFAYRTHFLRSRVLLNCTWECIYKGGVWVRKKTSVNKKWEH